MKLFIWTFFLGNLLASKWFIDEIDKDITDLHDALDDEEDLHYFDAPCRLCQEKGDNLPFRSKVSSTPTPTLPSNYLKEFI